MKNIILAIIGTVVVMLCYTVQAQQPVDPETIAPTKPGWETRYQNRINMLLNSKAWNYQGVGDTDDGKRYWPNLLAEMYKVRNNPTALQNLIDTRGQTAIYNGNVGTYYKPFSAPGHCMYFFEYFDDLPASQKSKVQTNWNSLNRTYTTRDDHHMDPIYNCTEFNSENFNWMARMGGYLMAHHFNDQTIVDGQQAMDYFETYMRNLVRATFATGRVEWNSHVYSGFCYQAVGVLHQYAKDPEVKKMARAIMDWINLENALHYLDGAMVGADSRDKGNGYKPFTGSAAGWNYIYFADDDYYPHLSNNFIINKFPGNWTIGFMPHFSYRPPQVIIDIAQRQYNFPVEMRNAKPFYWLDEDNYQHWQGNTSQSRRFEFEFQYMDEKFNLSSVVSGRPNGMVGAFSEINTWQLGVMGSDTSGVVSLFGNSHTYSSSGGRSPYEQLGQYRNVLMRTVKGTNNIWTCVPKNKNPEVVGQKVFADLGNDVYVALLPYNTTALNQTTHNRDTLYTEFKWSVPTGTLAAVVLEVGTKAQHGGYAQFKNSINNQATLVATGTDKVKYTSTAGRTLEIMHMPTGSYPMYCGGSVSPAAPYPQIWTNGNYVDFSTWNSYEVVYGDKIVDQKWGAGTLKIKSNHNDLTINIDPINGNATWWKTDPAAPASPHVNAVTLCGSGSALLTAQGANPAANYSYKWYQNITDTIPLATGHTFTTPLVNQSTSYYVTVDSGGKESMKTPASIIVANNPEDIVKTTGPPLPTDQLKAFFPFDGDAKNLIDGQQASQNTAQLATDRHGNANMCYTFPAVGNYIGLATSLSVTQANPRTYACWAQINQYNGGGLFSFGLTGFSYAAFILKTTNTTGRLELAFDNTAKFTFNLTGNPNSWHHLAFTYDGTNLAIYQNGTLLAAFQVTLNTSNFFPYLGRASYSERFSGKLDDFAIYAKALSAAEVQQLYLSDGIITNMWLEATMASNQLTVTLHNSEPGVRYFLKRANSSDTLSNVVFGDGQSITLQSYLLADTNNIAIWAHSTAGCALALDTVFNQNITAISSPINHNASNLTAFPNPTTGVLHLSHRVHNAQLFDTKARLIVAKRNVMQLDLQKLPMGFYFLRTEKGYLKVIKQ